MGGSSGPRPPRLRPGFWPLPQRPAVYPDDWPMPPRLSLFASYIVLLAAAALVVIALVFDWGWPVPLVALSVSLALGLAALLVSARREADPGLRRFGLVAVGFVLAAALAVALVR